MGDLLTAKEQQDLEHVVNWLLDLPIKNPRRSAKKLANDLQEAAAGLRRAASYLEAPQGGPTGGGPPGPPDEDRARLWIYASLLRLAGRR